MGQTSQRIAQLTLLSRLGQSLNAASGLLNLCQIIPTVLLEYPGITGIVLSPSGDQPETQRQYQRFTGCDAAQQAYLFQLEQPVRAKVLQTSRSQLIQITPLPGLPASLYCIPLRIHGKALGTLSVYGCEPNTQQAFRLEQQQLMLTCSFQIAQALEQHQTHQRLRQIASADARNLQDIALLYRMSQLLHSTQSTDDLMPLILSLLVHPEGGAFYRAMLFMVNERSHSLQGILGVTRETTELILPQGLPLENQRLLIDPAALKAQQQTEFSRQVMQLRLPLESTDSCLARVVREQRSILIQAPRKLAPENNLLVRLKDHACVPLSARQQVICVLVIDNYPSEEKIDEQRLHFLELFAAQAGIALDNAQLLHRLESAHRSLHETQEQLLHREKMAAIGEMSASIAHELRNPLAAVGGFARRLRKKLPADSSEFNYAKIIHEESERLEKMLDKILSFSRQTELNYAPYDLEDILQHTLLIEGDKLRRAGIELTLDLPEDLAPLYGDAEQIEQVLINLISNARQAMPEGGRLTIRGEKARMRGDEAIRLEIEDSGGGIPAEVMRDLFTPFFTTRKQGTGLGLSICQRIIEHHQGELKASNQSQGACFSLTLPTQLKKRPHDH